MLASNDFVIFPSQLEDIRVFIGLGDIPSFASLILNREINTVRIALLELKDEHDEVDQRNEQEVLKRKFFNFNDAVAYYNEMQDPVKINEIITEFKLKKEN